MKRKHFLTLSILYISAALYSSYKSPEPIVIEEAKEVTEVIVQDVIEQYVVEPVVEEVPPLNYTEVMLEVSYYCPCDICSEEWGTMTANGGRAVEGRTIAMPKEVPFGTEVYIEALDSTYIVEDRGGYIKTLDNNTMRVDIYVTSHSRALELGRHMSVGRIYN